MRRHILINRFLPALTYRNYRNLWISAICSQSAAWALIVGRGALALTLTDSPFWTAIVTFAALIPSVLVAPFAGVLADRFDRRAVLAWAYGVNLAHTFFLALLVLFQVIEPWHLVMLALVNGSARATQIPTAQALLPNTIPKERLFNGVALYQTAHHGSKFIGPLLILFVLWTTGQESSVFFVCTGLYVASLVFLLKIDTVSRGMIVAGRGLIYRNLLVGLKYIYKQPLVLSIVLLVVAHCAFTMSFESLFPVLSRDKFGMGPGAGFLAGFGYLMVFFGIGALIATVALAGVDNSRIKGRLLLWTAILSGITPVALGFSPNLVLAMISSACMGAAQASFMTLVHGMLQEIVPDGIRGRVMGIYDWHILGFMATIQLLNGTLAAFTSLTASIILSGAGIGFVLIVVMSFSSRSLLQLYTTGIKKVGSTS